MKHVPRLPSEPSGLAQYRALVAKRARNGQNPDWDHFREQAYEAYCELLNALAACQQGLCMYCEKRITDDQGNRCAGACEVEHVVPKSVNPAGTLDWTNLGMSCRPTKNSARGCGQAKGSKHLPQACDPRDIPLIPLLVIVKADGTMLPDHDGCKAVGISPKSMALTIDVLNINCESLRQERQNILREIRSQMKTLESYGEHELLAQMPEVVRERLKPDANGHLASRWTTIRYAYREWAEEYIAKNANPFTQRGIAPSCGYCLPSGCTPSI